MRIGHFLTLLFGIACTGTLEAGSDLPYDVVVTNVLGPGPGMVRVDLDSGEQTPIGGASGPVLATAADGSIYTVTGGTVLGETTLSRLDPQTMEWEVTVLEDGVIEPFDLDLVPDSGFLVADSLGGIKRLDFGTASARRILPPESEWLPAGAIRAQYGRVEALSLDEIFFSALLDFLGRESEDSVFRFRPSLELVERVDLNVVLSDFILESADTALGLGNESDLEDDERRLYRVNLDTGAAEILFESDLLRGSWRMALDPAGRPIVLTPALDQVPAQLVRIDLATKTTEIVQLDPTLRFPSDVDILVVPEPSTLFLLVPSVLLWAPCRLGRATGRRCSKLTSAVMRSKPSSRGWSSSPSPLRTSHRTGAAGWHNRISSGQTARTVRSSLGGEGVPVSFSTAPDAYEDVKDSAGGTAGRDDTDIRIIAELESRGGQIILFPPTEEIP